MKIMFVLDSPLAFQSGIWLHRNQIPSTALNQRGHAVRQVSMGIEFKEETLDWPDVVIFGRIYPQEFNPIKIMQEYKKRGKRVLYDIDDDIWEVSPDNPSVKVSNTFKDQYEGMIQVADAIITTSPVLANKIKKHFKKPIFICPNGIDYSMYTERPHDKTNGLKIGYMGAASHWKDLSLMIDVVSDLQKKHDFFFTIYGFTGEPLEAAMYMYNKKVMFNFEPERNPYYKSALEFYVKLKDMKYWHMPFMPPELHAKTLSLCDLDIGLAPLEDLKFNHSKSNVKFYEYASVGTVTLASDVHPYCEEVNYLTKNTYKDWYKKLERLIVDEEFRNKIGKQQFDWVKENRSTEAIGLPWELACQKPGGIKVRNQQ